MDTEKLRILLAVVENGSLSAAAAKTGYTTSGVSRVIASLEESCGFPLLTRKHDGVQPTESCSALLGEVREILFHENQLEQKAGEIRGLSVGTISIGTAYSCTLLPLQKLLSDFQGEHPGISFHLYTGFSDDLVQRLLDRNLDFAIIGKRDNVTFLPLAKSPMMAWVPAGKGFDEKKGLPLHIFEEQPYIEIYSGVDTDNKRILSGNNIHPNTQMHAQDSYTAFTMVEAGLGAALNEKCNCTFHSDRVTILPIEPPQYVEIGIANLPDLSPAARNFFPRLKSLATCF